MLVVTGIFFALLVLALIVITLLLSRKLRRHDYATADLSRDPYFQQRYGSVFPAYKQHRHWWTGWTLWTVLLRAVFIGACQGIPLGQLIPLIVIDLFTFALLCIFRPYQSKSSNFLEGFLTIARLVCWGLLITFLPQIGLNRIIVTVLGLVILVIQSVVILILLAILIVQISMFDLRSSSLERQN